MTGGVAEVVEDLLCKCKALTSNSSPTKNKERKGRKERRKEGRKEGRKRNLGTDTHRQKLTWRDEKAVTSQKKGLAQIALPPP
jgi:hypothetical protein